MPSTNGATAGRNGNGTFSKGNTFGQGNPHFRKVAGLRTALLSAISEEDIAAIIQQMITAAKAGDIQAAKFVLSYAVGQPDSKSTRMIRFMMSGKRTNGKHMPIGWYGNPQP